MVVYAGWGRFRNYEFIQFFVHFIKIVETYDLEKLQLKEHVGKMKPELYKLECLYKKYQGSKLTKELVALDTERGKLLCLIRKTAEAQEYHFIEERSTAARVINVIIKGYGSGEIERFPYAKETLVIKKLCLALVSDESIEKALQTLDLVEALKLLKATNDAFQLMFITRNNEIASVENINSTSVRRKLITMFEAFRKYLKAYDLINTTEFYSKIDTGINELIDKTNHIVKVRLSKKHASEERTEGKQ